MNIDKVLLSLIRLGLGITTDIQKENISDLFLSSKKQWEQLYETASFHGVSGEVLDGLQRVMDEFDSGHLGGALSESWWKQFILQWIGVVQQGYEAGNMQQLVVIDAIQRRWAGAGIRMMLMKGRQ